MRTSSPHPSRAFARVLISCLLLSPAVAAAAEVTVQNDNNNPGNPLPNFIPDDQISAWLTSPCDGNIVAVQVYWDSQLGGNPPSQEASISIFGNGVFPTPGAALQNSGEVPAVVVAPILHDGMFNEFRHLDQAMTKPLSVPVTTGQTFVVSLEILNQSSGNPLASSAVPDTDGCQTGLNSVFTTPGGWSDACVLGVPGDWLIRAVIDCPAGDVPAISEWGLVIMTLLVLSAGTILLTRSGRVAVR